LRRRWMRRRVWRSRCQCHEHIWPSGGMTNTTTRATCAGGIGISIAKQASGGGGGGTGTGGGRPLAKGAGRTRRRPPLEEREAVREAWRARRRWLARLAMHGWVRLWWDGVLQRRRAQAMSIRLLVLEWP
jgi:hypothetical protein